MGWDCQATDFIGQLASWNCPFFFIFRIFMFLCHFQAKYKQIIAWAHASTSPFLDIRYRMFLVKISCMPINTAGIKSEVQRMKPADQKLD